MSVSRSSGVRFIKAPASAFREDVFFSDWDSGEDEPALHVFCSTAVPSSKPGKGVCSHSPSDARGKSLSETAQNTGQAQTNSIETNSVEKSGSKSEDKASSDRIAKPRRKGSWSSRRGREKKRDVDEVVSKPVVSNENIPGDHVWSDVATAPTGQDEDVGKSHKTWRLGETVVAIGPSGFSSDEGEDLFSDSFREKAFRAPQALSCERTSSCAGKDLPSAKCVRYNDPGKAGLDEHPGGLQSKSPTDEGTSSDTHARSSLAPNVRTRNRSLEFVATSSAKTDKSCPNFYFDQLAKRLAQKSDAKKKHEISPGGTGNTDLKDQQLRPLERQGCGFRSSYEAMCNDAVSEGLRGMEHSVPLAASSTAASMCGSSSHDTDNRQEVSPVVLAEPGLFEYDLPPDDEKKMEDDDGDDDDAQLDLGSQFHCYGDVAFEETPSENAEGDDDRIESSLPEEDAQCTKVDASLPSVKCRLHRADAAHPKFPMSSTSHSVETQEWDLHPLSIAMSSDEPQLGLDTGLLRRSRVVKSADQSEMFSTAGSASPELRPSCDLVSAAAASSDSVDFREKVLLHKPDRRQTEYKKMGDNVGDLQPAQSQNAADFKGQMCTERISPVSQTLCLGTYSDPVQQLNPQALSEGPETAERESIVKSVVQECKNHAVSAVSTRICYDATISPRKRAPQEECHASENDKPAFSSASVLDSNGLEITHHALRNNGNIEDGREHENLNSSESFMQGNNTTNIGAKRSLPPFSYQLPGSVSGFNVSRQSSEEALGFVGFKTAKGNSFALKPEGVKRATSLLGGILGEMRALGKTYEPASQVDGHANGSAVPASSVSPGQPEEFPQPGVDSVRVSSDVTGISSGAVLREDSEPVSIVGSGTVIQPATDFQISPVHKSAKNSHIDSPSSEARCAQRRCENESDRPRSTRRALSGSVDKSVGIALQTAPPVTKAESNEPHSPCSEIHRQEVSNSSKHSKQEISFSGPSSRSSLHTVSSTSQKSHVPFDYGILEAEESDKSKPFTGFKTCLGRSLAVKTNKKSVASIFGNLLCEMQALQSTHLREQAQPSQRAEHSTTHEVPHVQHPRKSHEKEVGDAGNPVFTTGSGKVVNPSDESMSQVAARYGEVLPSSRVLSHEQAEPVFTTGSGKISEPSQQSMQRALMSYGETTFDAPGCDEPVFSRGSGKVVQPSHESMLLVQASYGDKDGAGSMSSCEDLGPMFSKGTGKVLQPSAASLKKAKALYGEDSYISRAHDSTTEGAMASPVIADGMMDSPASLRRPLVPTFGNNAGRESSHLSMSSKSASAAGKRPATSNNDRRPFKMPRKFEAPALSTPSASSSSANNNLIHDNGTACSSARSLTGHDSPRTPGLSACESILSSTSSSGKALATPRHLFSPNTAMKINGFRVTNAALMDLSSTSSVERSMCKDEISVSGDISVMSADDSIEPDLFQKRLDQAASLSLTLKDAVQNSLPFEDWSNGNIEIQEYMKIRRIGPRNAASFKFTCGSTHLFALSESASDSEVQVIGLEEIYAAVRARAQDAHKQCPDIEWAENHYKWIVWKLASMERAFPSIFGGQWLTPDRVMLQLMNRYDREVLGSSRSVLQQIKQRDLTGSQYLVLCVSGITTGEQNVMLELMDGWHSIEANASPAIAHLISQGKIFVGQKLRLYGSETVIEEGKNPVMKIGRNGVRRAEWHAKLGSQAVPPFFIGLRTIAAGEGVVPAILVVVQRVFPLVHMDSLPSGEKLWRSTDSEEVAQAAAQKAQQDAWEAYVTSQMKVEGMDGEAETKEAVEDRQEKFEEWRKDFVKSQAERKVCSVMRIRVACLHPASQDGNEQARNPKTAAEAYITFWRPQESIQSDVKEGSILELHNLAVASVSKNDLICLSSMKGTRCRPLHAAKAEEKERASEIYRARTFTDVSQLHRAPVKQEVDILGVVVEVSEAYTVNSPKGPKPKQAIVLTCPCQDGSQDEDYVVVRLDLTGLVAIKMPTGREGKKRSAFVLAAKNVNDVCRVSLRGEEADCNVFTCSAFEDAQMIVSTPAVCNGGDTSVSRNSESLSERWSVLAEWIEQDSKLAEEQRVLPHRALRARRILHALRQGVS